MDELLNVYRIVEKQFADGKSKFVPEQCVSRPYFGDEKLMWSMIGPTCNNIDEAREEIQKHKNRILSETLVKEIIHEYK